MRAHASSGPEPDAKLPQVPGSGGRSSGPSLPGTRRHGTSGKGTFCSWLAPETQIPADAPDPGRGAPSVTMPQATLSCVAAGVDEEDRASFLLLASPDRWLGSLEGKGGSSPSRVPARSSPLGRAEPGFLADPEPSSQNPADGPREPWGSDVSCRSLALRDEVDSISLDSFAY
ncbi:hypothetical protein CB1_002805004 [Camelus ferus]|nr:hypothetical protein CB1_002805004 [Camelus ferus]